MEETKTCAHCQQNKPISFFGWRKARGTYLSYCRDCLTEVVNQYRDNWKAKAIAYKGGKCAICGYFKCQRALVFHHRDPSSKGFTIGAMRMLSWNKLITELDKCILLCANCHAEVHDNISVAP